MEDNGTMTVVLEEKEKYISQTNFKHCPNIINKGIKGCTVAKHSLQVGLQVQSLWTLHANTVDVELLYNCHHRNTNLWLL